MIRRAARLPHKNSAEGTRAETCGHACPRGGLRGGAGFAGGAGKKERAPRGFPQGARESSGDLLSRIRGPGTIGDAGLDFRVRDGNGYDPHSITAETNSAWNLDSLSNRQ